MTATAVAGWPDNPDHLLSLWSGC